MLKLAQYMRPKCHALLLDGGINSETTVRLNIYQVWIMVWINCVRQLVRTAVPAIPYLPVPLSASCPTDCLRPLSSPR